MLHRLVATRTKYGNNVERSLADDLILGESIFVNAAYADKHALVSSSPRKFYLEYGVMLDRHPLRLLVPVFVRQGLVQRGAVPSGPHLDVRIHAV